MADPAVGGAIRAKREASLRIAASHGATQVRVMGLSREAKLARTSHSARLWL